MQSDTCGAKTRSGKPCKNAPMENGRCRMHGGASLRGIESPQYKSGRYSKYVPESVQDKIASLDNYNVLDLADELQAQRALMADYMSRYQAGSNMSEHTISSIMAWINSIGVMVERIMKIRNDTALTSAEIAHLQARTANLVTKYIDDPERRRQFIVELFQIEQPHRLE